MLNAVNIPYDIVLASQSPRRQDLLQQTGLKFRIHTRETDEAFDEGMRKQRIAMHIAAGKAKAILPDVGGKGTYNCGGYHCL